MRMRIKIKNINKKMANWLFIYRYDFFALTIMSLIIFYYVSVLFQPGHVVFSDIDFPFYSKNYMDEIYGLWNTRWNTVSMLNIPRLFFILPLYLLSGIFEWNGHLMVKGFILELMILSACAMYLFAKRVVSVYMGRNFNMWKVNALIVGSTLYALNPWMIYRIQHIYLLTGYSLFPLVLLYFFKVFDHKFQRQFIQDYSPYARRLYKRNVIDILILAYLITLSSAAIHYFFYAILVLGLLYVLLCVKYLVTYLKNGTRILKQIFQTMFKKVFVLGITLVGLSFYWLSIYIGGIILNVSASQHNINVVDTYTMFSRHASLPQVMLMMGYWWPMIDLNALPSIFYIGGSIILVVIGIGILFNAHRHSIVLFFAILTIGTIVVATGTYYPNASGLFLKLASLPVFGNVFRDPNKMIGLTAVAYSVLLIFGIETIYQWTAKRKYASVWNSLIFSALLVAAYAYLFPIRELYFERYYQPVEEPQAYQSLRAYYEGRGALLDSGEAAYALYVPVADNMTRPVAHVATPRWNIPEGYENVKATGDIHIYNSPVNTVFQHEGNDPAVKYLHDLIQFNLDQGRTINLDKLVKAFGVNQLIYHNEYLEQEVRQAFNERILALQSGLKRVYENSIFEVYNLFVDREDVNFSQSRFITPYGMIKMSSLANMAGYDPLKTPVVFMTKEATFDKELIGKKDIIESKQIDDLILSSLPEAFKLYPFNYVNEVNPFIKWGKTYTTFSDWAWFQNKLDVIHPSFDWDHDRGMVLTFASEAFNVLPYEKKMIQGETVYDFNSLLRADSFFVADNPNLFEVISNPYNMTKNVGVLHGVIQKGDPKYIWQVAKSPILTAEEKMPYQFRIVVSGRGANKLHMKARFYDRNKKEIGIQYIVGPDEFVNFDSVDFTGEVVTPKDTAFFRVDLLTFQRPKEKTYWWIHDVEIKKFPKYTAPNSIVMEKAVKSGAYKIFVKSFESIGGGAYNIKVNDRETTVATKSSQLSGFKWHALGVYQFSDESVKVVLTNESGFNAVQHLVIVPVDVYEHSRAEWEAILNAHQQMIILETEIDFNRDGNLQSRRLFPEFSNGTGTSLSSGKLTAEIEIATPGLYDLSPSIYFKSAERGKAQLVLKDGSGNTVITKDISKRTAIPKGSDVTIEYDPLGQVYPYRVLDKSKPYRYQNVVGLDGIALKKGKYQLVLIMQSENENYVNPKSFHAFDPSTIITESSGADLELTDNRSCEKITPDMMRHRYMSDDLLRIDYDATCSYEWYIFSSDPVVVEPNEELLVSFEARSDAIVDRHSKLVFLDAYDQVIDTTFVFEVEEDEKTDWHRYEQLIKIPEDAKKVLYQVWAKGNKSRSGMLELKNFKLEKYNEFILADKVVLKSAGLSLQVNSPTVKLEKNQISEMRFSHQVEGALSEETIWNSFLSPHNIWKVNGEASDFALNGVTMGFRLKDSQLEGQMNLAGAYVFGLLLHFLTIIGMASIYVILRKRGRP